MVIYPSHPVFIVKKTKDSPCMRQNPALQYRPVVVCDLLTVIVRFTFMPSSHWGVSGGVEMNESGAGIHIAQFTAESRFIFWHVCHRPCLWLLQVITSPQATGSEYIRLLYKKTNQSTLIQEIYKSPVKYTQRYVCRCLVFPQGIWRFFNPFSSTYKMHHPWLQTLKKVYKVRIHLASFKALWS